MNRRLIIAFLLILTGSQIMAQEIHISSIDTSFTHGEHDVGWIHSHYMDNWYLDVNGGGLLYFGFEDREGPLKDQLTANFEWHLGRWIFPMVGVRFGAGIGYNHGFVTIDSYNQYHPAHGIGSSYGTSATGALCGYYWPMDDNDQLYMQKWSYLYGGADFLVNLSYMKRYDRINFTRRLNQIVYFGLSVRLSLSDNHPEVHNDPNRAAEGHIGYIARYKINDHWNLCGDARLSIVEGTFDREIVEGVEFMRPDMMFNFMAGVSYDFNFRSDTRRRKYYIEKGLIAYNAREIPKYVAYVQSEDIKIINMIDTIMVYRTEYIDDSVIIEIVDSLQTTLDSVLHVNIAIPEETPLDSIFYNQLLPYEMVFFDLDKWDIRPSEEMKIAKMARIMKAYPDRIFILTGSADAKTGTVKRNDFLSKNRADVIFNKLVLEYGIPESQMRREYLGGIMDYDPFPLNRTTVIIMDHPAVRKAFEEMRARRKAGGGVGIIEHP